MSTTTGDLVDDAPVLRRNQVQILAVLTGAAGLGAETLFFKFLDFTAGASALTGQVVVAAFILGMGLGAQLSSKIRRPYRVEAALALFSLSLALFPEGWLSFAAFAMERLGALLPPAVAASLFGFAVVAPVAVLLGITFPALVEREGEVTRPYLLQAVGSLIGIVLVEALLFPFGGLRLAFSFIAALHVASAWILRATEWRFSPVPIARPIGPLVAAGALSGLFQGTWLFLALLIFNPFYFIQPIVVVAMLLGLFAGARLFMSRSWSFPRTLSLCALGVGVSAAMAGVAVQRPAAGSFWLVLPCLLVLVAAGSVPVGALYPSYFGRASVDRASAGAGLLSLAMGNVLGLAAVGLMTSAVPVTWLFVIAALGLLSLARGEWRLALAGVTLAIFGAGLSGDRALLARDRTGSAGTIEIEHLIRGPAELTGVYRRAIGEGVYTRRLYQTGFSPIDLDHGLEVSIALAAVAYAPEHQRALVIGAGSGKTAGVVARAFDRTEVFDVGTTVRPLLEYLAADNYQLLQQPGLRYHALDGLLAPYVVEPGLDLIVLTVDPAYHFKAAKLYAEESLRALKGLLRPGGVLVFWADATTNAEAAQSLLNTGAAVFREQRMFLATPGPRGRRLLSYFFLVHSDGEIRYQFDRAPVQRVAGLDEKTRFHAEPDEAFRLPAPGRLHPTTKVHRLVSPSPHVLIGGFRAERLHLGPPPVP